VGGEFQITTFTTSGQRYPSVGVDADGDALFLRLKNQDGDSKWIYFKRVISPWIKVGGEFQVNTYTTGNQGWPSVALDADGDAFRSEERSCRERGWIGVYGE